MSFYPELDDLTPAELAQRFDGPPIDEGVVAYYQEIADKLGAAGALDALWKPRTEDDIPRARAAILGISRYDPDRPRVERWLRDQLDRAPDIVAQAIDGLAQIRATGAASAVVALASHADEYVRGAVVRFLVAIAPDAHWKMIERAAADSSHLVRENVADELAALKTDAARALRARLATDPHPGVRLAATTG